MTTSSPPNYSAPQGRRFGVTLAIAFAVIAAFAYWRGRQGISIAFVLVSMMLLAAAAIAPRQLAGVDRGWMRLAHVLSRITTPIFMGILYFGVLTPVGFVRRRLARNPLEHEASDTGYWIVRGSMDQEVRRRRMERQF